VSATNVTATNVGCFDVAALESGCLDRPLSCLGEWGAATVAGGAATVAA
jgi:hypothetical protein